MNIYVCGNPLVGEDALPLRIVPMLRNQFPALDFIDYDPTENLPKERNLIIIDTVINVNDVRIFHDIDTFVQTKTLSLHDFDLGMNLKIAQKMGWIKQVTIIGVPPHYSEKKAVEEISLVIASLSSENEQHNSYRDHMHG